ncbi:hypothetical protein J0O71_14870, partial [Listeria monocytogenes]|nr:hypothetical protein [Listeria monocytogenes]
NRGIHFGDLANRLLFANQARSGQLGCGPCHDGIHNIDRYYAGDYRRDKAEKTNAWNHGAETHADDSEKSNENRYGHRTEDTQEGEIDVSVAVLAD